MSFESLPLKYRPLIFEDLVGQPVPQTYLSKLIQRKKSAHIILHGGYGSGKTTSGRIYARALNCLSVQESGSPCNLCINCKSHLSESFTDYVEMDAASSGKVDEIKKLTELAITRPMFGRRRILLIDEAQGLSKQAWDALLKLIEEPPEWLTFIFATTEVDKVRPAILSRCTALEVSLLDHVTSVTHLKKICGLEGFQYEEKALDLIAFVSKGHSRDLLKNLEQCSFYAGDSISVESTLEVLSLGYVTNIIKFMRAWREGKLEEMISSLHSWNSPPSLILTVIQEFLVFVLYSTVNQTGVRVNPVFESIPRMELAAFYNFIMEKMSPDIAGGIKTVLLDMVKILQGIQAHNSLSLDITVHSLHQLAWQHGFAASNYGKPGKVVVREGESKQGAGPQRRTQRQFVSMEAGAPTTQAPTPNAVYGQAVKPAAQPAPALEAPQQVQTPPPASDADKPVYGHTLTVSGFNLEPEGASDVVSL